MRPHSDRNASASNQHPTNDAATQCTPTLSLSPVSSPTPATLTKNKPPIPPKGGRSRFDPMSAEIPNQLGGGIFAKAWGAWVSHRREIKKPLTRTQTEAQLAKFDDWGFDRSLAAITHTIEMGWQGIREPDATTGLGPDGPTTGPPHEWIAARDGSANEIWRVKERKSHTDDDMQRAYKVARDKYGDTPKHDGKDAVSVGITLANNNRRAE